MDVNLGQFKYNFLFESIIGTSTVSLKTLEQSKLKVIQAIILLVIYGVENIFYIYNQMMVESTEGTTTKIIRATCTMLPVYSLIRGIWDYKTKISATLDLEAIERMLESQNINISGNSVFKIMSLGFMILQVLLQLMMLVSNMSGANMSLSITKYITSFQSCGVHLSCLTTLIMSQTKILLIQKAITKGFSEANEFEKEIATSRPSTHRGRLRGRRKRWTVSAQTEVDRKRKFLAELQGSLAYTEKNINRNVQVEVILSRMMMEVIIPILLTRLYVFNEKPLVKIAYLLTQIVCFAISVAVVESVHRGKEESYNQLSSSWEGSKKLRHQLLANIHRRRVSFSLLLDFNYSLLWVMLENSVLVITTVIVIWSNN